MVATYRLIHWKQIPVLVEAQHGGETARVPLSPRFQELVDAVAMREGLSESDAYLEGWGRTADVERPGDARAVAEAVARELEAGFGDLLTVRLPRTAG